MLPKDYGVQIGDPGTKMGMTELDVTALKKLYSCDSKPVGNGLDDENNENNENKDPNGDNNNFGDNFGDDNNIGGNFGDINGNNDNIGIGGNNIGGLPMPKPIPIPSGFGNVHIGKLGQNKRPAKHQDKQQDKNLDKNLDKHLDKLRDKLQEQNEGDKSILPMPKMPSLNYEKEKGSHSLNELTGNYGELGNMIDFSKLFGSFLKK